MLAGVLRGLAILISVALAGWLVASRVEFRSDLSFVTPRGLEGEARFLADRLTGGRAQGLLLIGIEGGAKEGRAQASAELADRLRQAGRFKTVANGAGPPPAAEFEYLFANRYLLGPAWSAESFTADAMRENLMDSVQFLATSPGQMLRRFLPADPTGRLRAILAGAGRAAEPHRSGGVWMSNDDAMALLIVQGAAETYDLDSQAAQLDHIRDTFAALADSKEYRISLTGPGVFAVATRARIRGDVKILSVISLGLLIALFWGGFRSLALLPGLVLPMGIGVLAGLAAVQLVDGYVHGITLAFGACLIGIAIDYPVHIVAHAAGGGSVRAALDEIWPTLRLSALTTVIAFIPFLVSDFPGLGQIGLFVACGLFFAVLASRFVFPLFCPTVERNPIPDRWLQFLLNRRKTLRWPLLAAALAAGAIMMFRGDGLWESDLAELSPVPTALVSLDRKIRGALGAPDPRHVIVVTGDSADRVLETQDSLRPVLAGALRDGAIGSFHMAADVLPGIAAQERRRKALPDAAVLRDSLAGAVAGTPYRLEAFAPFLRDVARARDSKPVTFAEFRASPAGDAMADYLVETPSGWSGVVVLGAVRDAAALSRAIAGAALPGVHALDLKSRTEAVVDAFLLEALRWLAVAAAAIVIVLGVALRHPGRVARVLGPVVLAELLTVGILAALDVRLSLFHILSLILVAGLGMDYGLFFSRRNARDVVTLRAVMLCNATTAAVFLVMAFSSIPVLHGIGLTVAVGAFLALVCAAAFTAVER